MVSQCQHGKGKAMSTSTLLWAYQGVFGDGRFNGTMQNVVGPTLVVMATTFGLGVEIQSPTSLFLVFV